MDIKIDSESMSRICDSLIRLCAERDALRDQLETTKRELMATDISWQNALAELDRLRKQKPIGFLLEHSDGAEFYNMEMSAKFNCTDKIQASVSPVYAAPVPAMPIPKQEPVGRISAVFNQGAGHFFNCEWLDHCNFKEGDLLYAAPQPAQAAAIPDKETIEAAIVEAHKKGWNDCIARIDSVLSASPKPE